MFPICHEHKQVWITCRKISLFDFSKCLLYVTEQTPTRLYSAYVSFNSWNLRNDFSIKEHNTTLLYDFYFICAAVCSANLVRRDAVNPYNNAIRCKWLFTKRTVKWNIRTPKKIGLFSCQILKCEIQYVAEVSSLLGCYVLSTFRKIILPSSQKSGSLRNITDWLWIWKHYDSSKRQQPVEMV